GSCPGRLKLASRCACARVSFEIGQRSMSGHRADGPVRVRSLAPRQRGGTGARRVVHKKSAAFQRYLPGWSRAGDRVEGCCSCSALGNAAQRIHPSRPEENSGELSPPPLGNGPFTNNVSLIRWSSELPSSSKSDLMFVSTLRHCAAGSPTAPPPFMKGGVIVSGSCVAGKKSPIRVRVKQPVSCPP